MHRSVFRLPVKVTCLNYSLESPSLVITSILSLAVFPGGNMEYPTVAYLLAGLGLLFVGGEFVVRGSVGLAKSLGVSPLLIGLVVIAFGTSSPELFIAINAVSTGADTIAMGNVIGSNIANILLVLGIGALIYPIPARGAVIYRDGSIVLGVTGFLIFLAYRGTIDQSVAFVLLGFLLSYLVFSFFQERLVQPAQAHDEVSRNRNFVNMARAGGGLRYLLVTGAGIGALIFGSQLLVDSAIDIARSLNVSESTIAVSMVAIGTSIPELAAVIAASLRRHSDLVIGGILGSNIFNVLIVLGIPALIWPIDIAPEFLERDIWVMAGAALILMPFLLSRGRLGRPEGLALLALYAGYIYVLYEGMPVFL